MFIDKNNKRIQEHIPHFRTFRFALNKPYLYVN
ncbi:BgTH12-00111 [Blumeria graminis f. sp. triticale]|uniref:BgTH12-00111 n=1 Tax=Blumeria graminis f. sp. triticale TaxID=1689686 RepID=A0A9W4D5C8_BLUGR|nr:BgTH12-00111 [Blumeria graminis f. sp. triticale]